MVGFAAELANNVNSNAENVGAHAPRGADDEDDFAVISAWREAALSEVTDRGGKQ